MAEKPDENKPVLLEIGKILNSAVHTTIVEGWDLGVSGFVQNSPKGVKGLYAVH